MGLIKKQLQYGKLVRDPITGNLFNSISDLIKAHGVGPNIFYKRLKQGVSIERCLLKQNVSKTELFKELGKIQLEKVCCQINEDGSMPIRAHLNDAGYDLSASETIIITPQSTVMIRTQVHILIPEGFVGLIFPRSSMSAKGLLTHTGVIDADYTGEVKITITNLSQESVTILKKQRVAQIVVLKIGALPFVAGQVTEIKTARGENGFGSTGK